METISRTKYKQIVGALASAAFVVGTAELVVVGILSMMADSLRVSVSEAGLLVTAYALGIALVAPIITAFSMKFSRRRALLLAMGVYILGNVAALLAGSFEFFVFMRVVTGALHGLIIGTAFTVGAAAAPKGQEGRAISIVFAGLSVATVLGVPFGSLLGQLTGWETAFWVIIALAAASTVANMLIIHDTSAAAPEAPLRTQAKHALRAPVLAVLLLGLILLGGQFTTFTYLESLLREVTHVSGGFISLFLLLYGAACAVGTIVGGKFADHNASKTLLAANGILIVLFLLLYFAAAQPLLMAIVLIAWGFVGFGLIPSYQLKILSLAKQGKTLASTLGVSAVNAGVAIGAVTGGWALAEFSPATLALASAVICTLALPLSWRGGYAVSRRTKP